MSGPLIIPIPPVALTAIAVVFGDSSLAAVIAGCFGIVGTVVHLVLMARLTRETKTTRQIIDRRGSLKPPPDGEYKRRSDPPTGEHQIHDRRTTT